MDKAKEELYYFNKFNIWDDAVKYCNELLGGGYNSEHILEKVIKSTNLVLKGEGLYEQDGVVYKREHNNYELLFALFYVFSKENRLRVCDFGGSLGSNFFHYREILPGNAEWSVVEQPNYVNYGKDNIKEISFFNSLDECLSGKDIDVIVFSGSLQYLKNPYQVLCEAVEKAKYIILDETSFHIEDESESIYIQHTPAEYYGVETYYPIHIFNKKRLLHFLDGKGFIRKFEWLYDGRGDGIPILIDDRKKGTIDRGFLMARS